MQYRKYFYVDKNYILGAIGAQNMTVKEFCEKLGCSRVNFYSALRRKYFKKEQAVFIKKIIKELDLYENLVWEEEA